MLVVIYTDTFADSQRLYDLCSMSELVTYTFVDEGNYGIEISVNTLDERFAFEKVSRYAFTYFGENKA